MDDVSLNLFLTWVKDEWSLSVHTIFSVTTLPVTHLSRGENVNAPFNNPQ